MEAEEMRNMREVEENRKMIESGEADKRINEVSGVCCWCGKITLCEVGCMASGIAYAFCDYNCYGRWNISHGLGPLSEVPHNEKEFKKMRKDFYKILWKPDSYFLR